MAFYTYMLECADGTLYTGFTTDPLRRLKTHNEKKGARYTRSRLPVHLVYLEIHDERHDALSREYHLKRLSRKEKQSLIESDCNRLFEYLSSLEKEDSD